MRVTRAGSRAASVAAGLGLLLAGCAQGVSPMPVSDSVGTTLAVPAVEPEQALTSVQSMSQSDQSLLVLEKSSLSAGLEVGMSQTTSAGIEIEYFSGLSDIRDRSSAVIVGRVLGSGPGRVIVGDVPNDVLTMESIEIEVIEFLAGTRTVEVGEVLLMEPMQPVSEIAHDTVWILFLRNKQDDGRGMPNSNALESEIGIWRQVNSQGMYVDTGQGHPVNPVAVAAAWGRGDRTRSLEEFAVSVYDPSLSADPVEREVAAMTTAELLDFLRSG